MTHAFDPTEPYGRNDPGEKVTTPCSECVALGLDPNACPAPREGRFPRTSWRKRVHAVVAHFGSRDGSDG